jgi:hypothetical protein
MRIQILFKDTKNLITTTLKELAADCGTDYSEFEVLQVLNEMRQRNEIEYINISKKIAV